MILNKQKYLLDMNRKIKSFVNGTSSKTDIILMYIRKLIPDTILNAKRQWNTVFLAQIAMLSRSKGRIC